MIKKYLLLTLALLIVASPVLAVGNSAEQERGDTNLNQLSLQAVDASVTNVIGIRDSSGNMVFRVSNAATGVQRVYGFTLEDFRLASGTTVTANSLIVYSTTAGAYLNFPDGVGPDHEGLGSQDAGSPNEKITASFVVPFDYRSGGTFQFWVEMDSTSPDGPVQSVGHEIYVQPVGGDAGDGYTLFATAALTDAATIQQVTFATSGLSAGTTITTRFWRVEDQNNATRAVRVFGGDFLYSASY